MEKQDQVIEPDVFYNNWKEELKKNYDKDSKAFSNNYHDNTRWTVEVKRMTEELLGRENISREYYRIDTLQYQYTETYEKYTESRHKYTVKNGGKLNVHNWINLIAVEYENSESDWTDELIKLANIRAKLKVIICYSRWGNGKESYLSAINEKMTFATKLLEGVSQAYANDSIMKDKWLIIIGPCGAGRKTYDSKIADCFIGYKLEGKKFIKIS